MSVELIWRYFDSFQYQNAYLHFVFYYFPNYKRLWVTLLLWFSISYTSNSSVMDTLYLYRSGLYTDTVLNLLDLAC